MFIAIPKRRDYTRWRQQKAFPTPFRKSEVEIFQNRTYGQKKHCCYIFKNKSHYVNQCPPRQEKENLINQQSQIEDIEDANVEFILSQGNEPSPDTILAMAVKDSDFSSS